METEVILMIAAFICSIIGMALAKSAKKNSSYFMLVASVIFALLTVTGLVASVIFVFFIK